MSRGQIYIFALRLLRREAIPLFSDNRVNRAINDAVERILSARTRRRGRGW